MKKNYLRIVCLLICLTLLAAACTKENGNENTPTEKPIAEATDIPGEKATEVPTTAPETTPQDQQSRSSAVEAGAVRAEKATASQEKKR